MDKTYTKISDTEIKVTESVETVLDITTLKTDNEELLSKKASLEKEKQQNISYYDKKIAEIQKQIDGIDAILSEAGKVGVGSVEAQITP